MAGVNIWNVLCNVNSRQFDIILFSSLTAIEEIDGSTAFIHEDTFDPYKLVGNFSLTWAFQGNYFPSIIQEISGYS